MGGFAGLGLGIVGAGIGSAFAPCMSASWSARRSAISYFRPGRFAPSGPKLSDLRVQVSSHAPVPRSSGLCVMRGVIWSTDKTDRAHHLRGAPGGRAAGRKSSTNYSSRSPALC